MILVFKTDCNVVSGDSLVRIISAFEVVNKINFDFEDCDNILRIDSTKNISRQIISLLTSLGYECIELH